MISNFLIIQYVPAVIVGVIAIVIVLFGFKIVPQDKVYIIERLGVYSKTLKPGLHFLVIGIERIRDKVPTAETTFTKVFVSDTNNTEIKVTIIYKINEPVNFSYQKSIVMDVFNSVLKEHFTNNGENSIFDIKVEYLLDILKNHPDLHLLQVKNIIVE